MQQTNRFVYLPVNFGSFGVGSSTAGGKKVEKARDQEPVKEVLVVKEVVKEPVKEIVKETKEIAKDTAKETLKDTARIQNFNAIQFNGGHY
jgi:hypothetical protein